MEKENVHSNSTISSLLLFGAISGVVFTLSWIIQEIFKNGYNPIMVPISSLAIGELGWIQSATFLITGASLMLFAYGLERIAQYEGFSKWIVIFLAIGAIGLIGAGCFTTDPINGFPPGTPETITESTLHGTLHQLFSVLLFIGLPVAMALFSKYFLKVRNNKWWIYSISSTVLFIMFVIILKVAILSNIGFLPFYGLIQRIILVIGFLWLILISYHYFKVYYYKL